MVNFNAAKIMKLLEQLNRGEIKPEHKIKDEFGDITLLHAVVKSELSVDAKAGIINKMIKLGCDVDVYASTMTPISQASMGVGTKSEGSKDNIRLVELMLKHHKKGHMSDLDILKSGAKSFDVGMFPAILKSNLVDTNVTRMRGTHILHYLSEVDGFNPHFRDIFKYQPDTIPNPINRKGLSPLTIAVNNLNDDGITGMLLHRDAKLFGDVTKPKLVVQYGIVSRYDGNFWEDFPDMIKYAVDSGKENLLPKTAADIFLF